MKKQDEYKTTSLDDVMGEFSPDRQKRIKLKAQKYVQEYETLQQIRKEMSFTQVDVAEQLGVNQVNVSNLENRSDMLVSTLRGYIEAMGGELTIMAEFPDTQPMDISGLIKKPTERASPVGVE